MLSYFCDEVDMFNCIEISFTQYIRVQIHALGFGSNEVTLLMQLFILNIYHCSE